MFVGFDFWKQGCPEVQQPEVCTALCAKKIGDGMEDDDFGVLCAAFAGSQGGQLRVELGRLGIVNRLSLIATSVCWLEKMKDAKIISASAFCRAVTMQEKLRREDGRYWGKSMGDLVVSRQWIWDKSMECAAKVDGPPAKRVRRLEVMERRVQAPSGKFFRPGSTQGKKKPGGGQRLVYYAVLECECPESAIPKLLVTVVKTERGRPEDGGWVPRMAGNDKEEWAMERLADSGTVCAAMLPRVFGRGTEESGQKWLEVSFVGPPLDVVVEYYVELCPREREVKVAFVFQLLCAFEGAHSAGVRMEDVAKVQNLSYAIAARRLVLIDLGCCKTDLDWKKEEAWDHIRADYQSIRRFAKDLKLEAVAKRMSEVIVEAVNKQQRRRNRVAERAGRFARSAQRRLARAERCRQEGAEARARRLVREARWCEDRAKRYRRGALTSPRFAARFHEKLREAVIPTAEVECTLTDRDVMRLGAVGNPDTERGILASQSPLGRRMLIDAARVRMVSAALDEVSGVLMHKWAEQEVVALENFVRSDSEDGRCDVRFADLRAAFYNSISDRAMHAWPYIV